MHIRVNDTVEVISGDDRETRGRVLKVELPGQDIVVQRAE
jgi:ribosomal protein L24